MRNFEGEQPRLELDVEAAKQKIISNEGYAQAAVEYCKANNIVDEPYQAHEEPYNYSLEGAYGRKKLFYYGTEAHTSDPEHPMLDNIESHFKEVNPEVVMVEGMYGLNDNKEGAIEWFKKATKEEAVKKYGEPGLTLKLAMDKGIDFASAEPQFKDEVKHLLDQGQSKENIFAFYMLRKISQTQDVKNNNFDESLNDYIDRFKQDTDWENFDFSIDNLNRIINDIFKEDIRKNDPDYYKEKVDGVPWVSKEEQQTILNEIGSQSLQFRDEQIVENIAGQLNQHNKVFIVYGSHHAFVEKPALEELLKK